MLYFIISLVTFFTYLVFKGRRYFTEFSKAKYNLKKIKLFSLDKYLTLELFGIILVVLAFFLTSKTVGILFIIFYMILSLFEIRKFDSGFKLDKKATYSILITSFIYLVIFVIIFIDYFNYQKGFIFYDRVNYYYLIVFIIGYLEYLIIYLSFILCGKLDKKKRKK